MKRRILCALVSVSAATVFATDGPALADPSFVSWTIPGTTTVCTFDPTLPTLASVAQAEDPALLAGLTPRTAEIMATLRTESSCDGTVHVVGGVIAMTNPQPICDEDGFLGTSLSCDNDTYTEPSADSCPGYSPYGPWITPPKFPGCLTAEIHLHTHFSLCGEDYRTAMQLKMQVYDSSKTGGWTLKRGNLHSVNWSSGTTSIYTTDETWPYSDHTGYDTVGEAASPNLDNCSISKLGLLNGLNAVAHEQIHTGYMGVWQLHNAGSSGVLAEDEYCFAADWDITATLATSGECTQP